MGSTSRQAMFYCTFKSLERMKSSIVKTKTLKWFLFKDFCLFYSVLGTGKLSVCYTICYIK